MMPVEMASEPPDFHRRVKERGLRFLQTTPHPTTRQWNDHTYWRSVLPFMRNAYDRICAYCATRILVSTGGDSVDHFQPRTKRPDLAYEWSNFRYASIRFNRLKGIKEILDPFTIEPNWFTLDFDTFLIIPAPHLDPHLSKRVRSTIEQLKLNTDHDIVNERMSLIHQFLESNRDFETLRWMAPFIAYELERQGIIIRNELSK